MDTLYLLQNIFLYGMPFMLAGFGALYLNGKIAREYFPRRDDPNVKRNFLFEAVAICVKQGAISMVVFFMCYLLGSLVRGEVRKYNSSGDGFAAPLFPSYRGEYDMIGNLVVTLVPLFAAVFLSKYAVQKYQVPKQIYGSSLLMLFAVSPMYLIALAVFYW